MQGRIYWPGVVPVPPTQHGTNYELKNGRMCVRVLVIHEIFPVVLFTILVIPTVYIWTLTVVHFGMRTGSRWRLLAPGAITGKTYPSLQTSLSDLQVEWKTKEIPVTSPPLIFLFNMGRFLSSSQSCSSYVFKHMAVCLHCVSGIKKVELCPWSSGFRDDSELSGCSASCKRASGTV